MRCNNCGAEVIDGSAFCNHCGARLNSNAPTENAAPANFNSNPQACYNNIIQRPEPNVPSFNESANNTAPKSPATTNKSLDNGKNTFKDKVLPFLKKYKFVFIGVIAAILAIVVIFSIVKAVHKPERVVKAYIKALISEDYEKAFNQTDLVESKFITAENFADKVRSEGTDYTEFDKFKVKDEEEHSKQIYKDSKPSLGDRLERKINKIYVRIKYGKSAAELYDYAAGGYADDIEDFYDDVREERDEILKTRTLYVHYKRKSNPYEECTKTITVVNTSESKMFPKYKVMYSNGISTLIIEAPEGAKVKLNGVELEHYEGTAKYENAFQTGTLFSGIYDMEVTHPVFETLHTDVQIYESNGREQIVSVPPLNISKESAAKIENLTKTLAQSIINDFINKTPFDALKIDKTSDKDFLSGLTDTYNSLIKFANQENGSKLTKLKINEFYETHMDKQINNSGIIGCRIPFDYTYEGVVYDSWDDELNDVIEDEHGSVYFGFAYENGKWVICSMNFYLNY